MRKVLLLCACTMLLSLAAFAQKGEAYIGYSHFTSGKNGWNGDLGYNLGRPVVVVADFGGYYSDSDTIHSFMVGAKVRAPHHHGLVPWGQFLIGGSHDSKTHASDTTGSWALGGGFDTSLRSKIALRLTADAFHTHFYNDGDLHLRIGAGIVYHF